VTVTRADEAATRATQLGATRLDAPFDVMQQGRMAIIRDPTGAVLQLWEPRRRTSA
jgi:predicted enzyme related to lactoylglutathione lyase